MVEEGRIRIDNVVAIDGKCRRIVYILDITTEDAGGRGHMGVADGATESGGTSACSMSEREGTHMAVIDHIKLIARFPCCRDGVSVLGVIHLRTIVTLVGSIDGNVRLQEFTLLWVLDFLFARSRQQA